MIICTSNDGEFLWYHENNSIKEETYPNDDNVFIVDVDIIEFPPIVDDQNIYKYYWDKGSSSIYLKKVGPRPISVEQSVINLQNLSLQTSDDILSTMELNLETNLKVIESQSDNLLNMEILLEIQKQLLLMESIMTQGTKGV